ncbi:MAG: VWA domain-containing protein [Labilithrix sp.]|nr:VWA domain-containing protein [Labilithrix sp.]
MAQRTGIALSLSLAAILGIACGSSDGSNFGDGNGGGDDRGGGGGGGGFGDDKDDGGGGGGDGLDDGGACAAQEVAATRKPVKLLLALDQSGSMGGGANNSRWVPVTTALKAFLAQPDTVGIEASMRLFPVDSNNQNTRCSAASYATPDVPMTALPNSTAFANKLVANPGFSGTPTQAVVNATVADAKVVQAANPQAKVAIVLITDGSPAGCSDNNIQRVVDEVTGTKATIPTYVIGVGNVANLNLVAQGGGPRDAFVVAVDDPAATQAQFLAAINEIRGSAISCEIDIPPPPSGETLDADKVNVNYTPTGKPTEQLAYDEACKAGGWRYDDKANPKQVVLCPATCTVAKADPSAKVALAFGCTRRSSTPK